MKKLTSRESPSKTMSKALLYNPADPKKQRKPKPGHPWAVYIPGLFSTPKNK